MRIRSLLLGCLLFLCANQVFGLSALPANIGTDPSVFMDYPSLEGIHNQEVLAEKIQAILLQKIFLNPMFSRDISIIDDKEEEESPVPINFDMYNEIYAREMAKALAKQDLLKLKRHVKKEYR
jgi:hypothetical protein